MGVRIVTRWAMTAAPPTTSLTLCASQFFDPFALWQAAMGPVGHGLAAPLPGSGHAGRRKRASLLAQASISLRAPCSCRGLGRVAPVQLGTFNYMNWLGLACRSAG